MSGVLRKGLPPLTPRIASLRVDPRGYPIPWFVEEGDDFRIASAAKRVIAVREKLCWVCGQRLGVHLAFVAGPMCGINRTSSEPPAHLDCAQWSVKACPFLLLPHAKRRDAGLDDVVSPGGIAITRNPGVIMLWITKDYVCFKDGMGGWLIRMGEPSEVLWSCEGRPATRAEVLESITSGLPNLQRIADAEGAAAVAHLGKLSGEFIKMFVPAQAELSP